MWRNGQFQRRRRNAATALTWEKLPWDHLYIADSVTGATPVTSIADQIGSLDLALVPTGGRPDLIASDSNLGGEPSLDFDNASSEVLYGQTATGVLSDLTIFGVGKLDSDGTYTLCSISADDFTNNPQVAFRTSAAANGVYAIWVNGADALYAGFDEGLTDTDPHSFALAHSGGEYTLFIDGVSIGDRSLATFNSGTGYRIHIGALFLTGLGSWNGQIAAVAVGGFAATQEQIDVAHAWAADRFGL